MSWGRAWVVATSLVACACGGKTSSSSEAAATRSTPPPAPTPSVSAPPPPASSPPIPPSQSPYTFAASCAEWPPVPPADKCAGTSVSLAPISGMPVYFALEADTGACSFSTSQPGYASSAILWLADRRGCHLGQCWGYDELNVHPVAVKELGAYGRGLFAYGYATIEQVSAGLLDTSQDFPFYRGFPTDGDFTLTFGFTPKDSTERCRTADVTLRYAASRTLSVVAVAYR